VAGVTIVSVRDVDWSVSKVLVAVLIALLLALHAGARLEVRLQGDLPIAVHLEQGPGSGVFLVVDNDLGVPVQFSARVSTDPLPVGVERDWSGPWHEDQTQTVTEVSAHGKGVLFLGGR
jgi:hypothetical protein